MPRDTNVDEGIMAMIGPAIRTGVLERQTEGLAQILGRPASSLRDMVAAAIRDPSSDPGMDGTRDPRARRDRSGDGDVTRR